MEQVPERGHRTIMEIGSTRPNAIQRGRDVANRRFPARQVGRRAGSGISGKPAVVEIEPLLGREGFKPGPVGADLVDVHDPLGIVGRFARLTPVGAMAAGAVGEEERAAAGGQLCIDRSGEFRRLQLLQPSLDGDEILFPFRKPFRAVFLHQQKLHQHPVPLGGEGIGIEKASFGIVPPGRGIHIVMGQIEAGGPGDNIQLFVAVPHEGHAKHHGIGRAIGGAQGEQERAHVHMPKRLPQPHFHAAHLCGERLKGIVGIGKTGDRAPFHLPLMAGEAAHRPAAIRPHGILQRPRGIVGVRGKTIAGHRHPTALLDRRPLGLRPQRLFPGGPEGIKHFLIEVARQIGPAEEQFPAALRLSLKPVSPLSLLCRLLPSLRRPGRLKRLKQEAQPRQQAHHAESAPQPLCSGEIPKKSHRYRLNFHGILVECGEMDEGYGAAKRGPPEHPSRHLRPDWLRQPASV